jgi:acetyl esterase/lipase
MTWRRRLLLVVGFVALAAFAAAGEADGQTHPAASGLTGTEGAAQLPPATRHRKHADIPYVAADADGSELQSLDAYVPAAAGGAPVMVYVHGGGWRRGDKSQVGEKAGFFTSRGWLFVSVNYRLLPAGRHPANAQDVARGLAWVHEHATEFGGDPDQVFLMGHSAGAHLAALVATDDRLLKASGKDLSILQGVIALDTNTYDLPALMRSRASAYYGEVFGDDPAVWHDAAPINHVAAGKGIPGFAICYSRGMRDVPNPARRDQANAFAHALRAAGVPVLVVDASDRSHAEINAWFGEPDDDVTVKAIAFLEAQRGAAGGDAGAVPVEEDPAEQVTESLVRFSGDYVAGTRDRNGQFMGGTETMRLVAHRDMLFAGISYWTDQPGDDPRPGAQILRKEGPGEPWQVDASIPRALRVNTMESFVFTTDGRGTVLPEPVRLLIADAAPARARRGSGPLTCLTRDDSGGRWDRSRIAPRAPRNFVRAFGLHCDSETGVQHVFAGTGAGQIYRGTYDPEAPGRVRWDPSPEYSNPDFDGGPFTRCQGFCVANGRLYASVAPRLLERRDGVQPEWVEVFRWYPEERAGAGLRGITAVRAPDGDHAVVLGSREQEGRILRIDPLNGYAVTEELRSHEFLEAKLDGFIGGRLVAYNRFVPGTHPRTGEPIHWLSVAGARRGDYRAAWLLIRHADATYEPVRVFDPSPGSVRLLFSTRTVEYAPWSKNEIYTGGYDGAANKRENHNTAWIYRGVFSLAPP